MSRFKRVAAFLLFYVAFNGFSIEVLSSCVAHGIRPQSEHGFCADCGKLQTLENERCSCDSIYIKTMCDLCFVHFTEHGNRVPVETQKPNDN